MNIKKKYQKKQNKKKYPKGTKRTSQIKFDVRNPYK